MPLNKYCDWLEDLTACGDTINSKGLQNWIERYAEQYHQSKVNNVALDDVSICTCGTEIHQEKFKRGNGMIHCGKCNKPY